jgi:hypothetical protein
MYHLDEFKTAGGTKVDSEAKVDSVNKTVK